MKRLVVQLCAAAILIITMVGLVRAQFSLFSADNLKRGVDNPFIEGTYGAGFLSHKGLEGAFAPAGVLEIRLGFTEAIRKKEAVDLEEKFIYGGYSSTAYSLITADPGEVKSEMIRFGVGARNGFGYRIGFMDLIPYGGYSFDLSKATFTQTGAVTPADSAFLNRVAGEFRFGESLDAGIQLRLFRSLSVTAGAHGQIVFPRVIFPEWLGSYLMMASGLIIISEFSEEIVNSSSFLGPIMYFVLRNGIAYAFFAGMKSQMHWPFASESPLAVESLRLSATIVF